jgi:hypothetical protein
MLVSRRDDGGAGNQASQAPSISADGRYVAYVSGASNLVDGDTNAYLDVFRTDLAAGTTTRLTALPAGSFLLPPRLSGDGRYVAFDTRAALSARDTNGRIDTYVIDAETGANDLACIDRNGAQCRGDSVNSAVSGDGKWLVFDLEPSTVPVAGRYNAPDGSDVYIARNPFALQVFRDGFE